MISFLVFVDEHDWLTVEAGLTDSMMQTSERPRPSHIWPICLDSEDQTAALVLERLPSVARPALHALLADVFKKALCMGLEGTLPRDSKTINEETVFPHVLQAKSFLEEYGGEGLLQDKDFLSNWSKVLILSFKQAHYAAQYSPHLRAAAARSQVMAAISSDGTSLHQAKHELFSALVTRVATLVLRKNPDLESDDAIALIRTNTGENHFEIGMGVSGHDFFEDVLDQGEYILLCDMLLPLDKRGEAIEMDLYEANPLQPFIDDKGSLVMRLGFVDLLTALNAVFFQRLLVEVTGSN